MWKSIGGNLALLAIVVALLTLGVTAVSALILAVATGLTYVFSVSVWEAAVVVTVVAAVVCYRLTPRSLPYYVDDDDLPDLPYDEEPVPRIVITDLPDPSNRRRRRRRRL